MFSFVFFRADNLSNAFAVFGKLGNGLLNGSFRPDFGKFGVLGMAIVLLSLIYMFLVETRFGVNLKGLAIGGNKNLIFCLITFLSIILVGFFHPQTFIYFNF